MRIIRQFGRQMFSCYLQRCATAIALTHSRYPAALQQVLPMFAGTVVFTQRELTEFLLETEADWPWQKPQTKKLPGGSTGSKS